MKRFTLIALTVCLFALVFSAQSQGIRELVATAYEAEAEASAYSAIAYDANIRAGIAWGAVGKPTDTSEHQKEASAYRELETQLRQSAALARKSAVYAWSRAEKTQELETFAQGTASSHRNNALVAEGNMMKAQDAASWGTATLWNRAAQYAKEEMEAWKVSARAWERVSRAWNRVAEMEKQR